jgi:hypothetical protein
MLSKDLGHHPQCRGQNPDLTSAPSSAALGADSDERVLRQPLLRLEGREGLRGCSLLLTVRV